MVKDAERVRHKRYLGLLTVPFPMRLYCRLKFGIADIIRYEHAVLQGLSQPLASYLPSERRLVCAEGRSQLLCRRPLDFDGRPAVTLRQIGHVPDTAFWAAITEIAERLRAADTCLISAFNARTLLVHRQSSARCVPVMTDAFRSGRRTYWYQLPTASRRGMWGKFDRVVRRLRRRYGGAT